MNQLPELRKYRNFCHPEDEFDPKNDEMTPGSCRRLDAKMIGITPPVLTFSGMCDD